MLRKKRYWITLLIPLLFFVSRLELLRMRYQPMALSQIITQSGQINPVFKTKTLAGASMQYIQIGARKNLPLILFVHGSPGALSAYTEYLTDTLLSKKANLVAVDRLGFGYSDFGKTESSLARQALLIGEILKDFPGVPKILVGHSMGGSIIAKAAMDYPSLVNALLLVAPSISPEYEPSNRWRKVLDWYIFRCLIPPAFRVCNQEIIPLKEELIGIENDWTQVKIPVTVVQGTEDPLVSKENAVFAKRKLVNSSSVKLRIIEGGNHFILWSEPQVIKEELFSLLQQFE